MISLGFMYVIYTSLRMYYSCTHYFEGLNVRAFIKIRVC